MRSSHAGPQTYIWSAVDHLGLVRFELIQPNAWSGTLPIDHQEGELIENGNGEHQIRLAVADMGGAVQMWDLTDLLDPATPEIIDPDWAGYGNFFVERWRTPECISDDNPNAVWSIAAERVHLEGTPEHELERFYVMVGRVGIRILEFDPTRLPGSRLLEVGGIETPSGSGGLRIRNDVQAGLTDLLVLERDTGVRIFGR